MAIRGKATALSVLSVVAVLSVSQAQDQTFRITPQRPIEELRREALAATPPVQPDSLLKPDLVEIAKLDSSIHLDMRYAGTNNFISTRMYSAGRAFAQRPAAEALVRASRRVRQQGFGLLIHDAYRPWYVTRMFWDATPDSLRNFVANPATGSKHNRGCAIDIAMYDLRTGKPVEFPSGYDEFSKRAFSDYAGGTPDQNRHRAVLREAMEAEGFTVNPEEWWHFDYVDWRRYPVLNLRFEEISR